MDLGQEELKIQPTRDTPEVSFDALEGNLLLRGRCYPSDAKKFFEPIVAWVQAYVAYPLAPQTTVQIDLEYFNTTSGKLLLNLFELLKILAQKKHPVSVKWYEWEGKDEQDADYPFLDEFGGEYSFVQIIYK
jgi:SiaC family regulatory phosphoprotein